MNPLSEVSDFWLNVTNDTKIQKMKIDNDMQRTPAVIAFIFIGKTIKIILLNEYLRPKKNSNNLFILLII